MFKTAPLPVAPRNPALPAEPLGRALESAASKAFWFFLSVVPLLVLLGYFVGQVARARGVDVLVEPLLDIVPKSRRRAGRHSATAVGRADICGRVPGVKLFLQKSRNSRGR